MAKQFKIEAHIQKDILTVWHTYHLPEHIMKWNHASDDWHTPDATSDFKIGGRFKYRMEAKDQSFGFDFTGTFLVIEEPYHITYQLDDQRYVTLTFREIDQDTFVEVIIDAEEENSLALQKKGWQSILNHFKFYVESLT
jgi:uncharacterized protein YndB with AHSA1/START domain